MKSIATVKNIDWADQNRRELKVIINAMNSDYIQEPARSYGSVMTQNTAPLVESLNSKK